MNKIIETLEKVRDEIIASMSWMNDVLNLPESTSTLAPKIDFLHWQIFLVTMVVFFLIAGVVTGLYIKYRRKEDHQVTEVFHPPLWLEGAFVAVPFVVFMSWFTLGFHDFVWSRAAPKDAIDIYAMGKKWMWKYSYPDGPNMIDTLRVPVGRPVRLLITSRDVIHSFFAPTMRVKQDALPGRYTETWFEATKVGTFPIFCAEYCGLNHSAMIGNIVVMETREYDAWMDDVKRNTYASRIDANPGMSEAQATMVAQGSKLALEKGCARCHSIDERNTQLPPALGPTWVGLYRSERKFADGTSALADEAYLTRSMMDPMAQLVAGYPPLMPSYQGLLQSGEAAAIAEYIKTLKTTPPAKLGAR